MTFLSKIRNFFIHKKYIAIPLLGGLLFLFGFFSFFLLHKTPSLFSNFTYNRLCRNIFRQELSGNTLTLHYTLQNPADYGIYYEKAALPVYSSENQASADETVTAWLQQLSAIDATKLSPENRYGRQLLQRYLSLHQELALCPYYDEPLSPNSGMQQTLPILLSEYRFEKRKDIDDYLSLLSQADDYFMGLLTYEQEKADAGLFMSKSSIDALAAQCRGFLPEESINNGSHFLVDSFTSRLLEYQKKYPENLDDTAFNDYYQENLQILKNEMAPAYETIADRMESLYRNYAEKQQNNAEAEAKNLSEKQHYYTLLVRKYTGSYRPMEEIREMLYDRFDMLRQELLHMPKTQNSSFHSHPLSVENMLSLLQEDMKADFPPLPFDNQIEKSAFLTRQNPAITCDIKYISKSISASSAPAFYLSPPMDAFEKNVIYINPDSSLKGPSLFTTLAHEGFPGHLYQTVYARESGIADKKNPLRGLLDYPGYCEGWALYVELGAYDYAARYYAVDSERQRAARSLELCLCAILDFHIHYQGLTLSQTQTLLSQFGISDDAAKQLYDYIALEPANYLKYYLSYLEILQLKQKARNLWGEQYSDYRFHQFYLDAGPSDFLSLQELLDYR